MGIVRAQPFMLGWLARLGAVLASCAPVLAALIALVGTAATVWTGYLAASTFGVGVARVITDVSEYLADLYQSYIDGIGQNSDLLGFFLNLLAIDRAFEALGYFMVTLGIILGVVMGVMVVVFGAGVTATVYHKLRLFANIVSGTGATN